jgi:hypothetical protein
MSLQQKIRSPGPKKILALDGGGIRGMISVEILAKMEDLLRKQHGNDKGFVLADYFDYIAGTSTGAIVATALSLGWSVDKVKSFYVNSGAQMFDKASLLQKFKYSYEDTALKKMLQTEFGKTTTLGSKQLKTLLMMVMRNSTTDSPWPVSNNPLAKFNARNFDGCNLDLSLWQLVRASTAAPTYFPPEKVQIGSNNFVFVDGGITMYNNPAFQTFLMATLGPYQLGWETGEDKLLIVSVGTGTSPEANEDLGPADMNLLYNAKSLPSALMYSALNEQDLLCRTFGNCLCGDHLDLEVGDLVAPGSDMARPVAAPLFTYVRYNAELSRKGLDRLGLTNIEPQQVQKLDSVKHIKKLQQVGRAVASKQVRASHFSGFR